MLSLCPALLLLGGLHSASAHMGISSPVPLDRAVGDAYRYPNPASACHGKGAGAKYTWVWTPKFSGACEIYQNCFAEKPAGDLTMSGGAPHGGGPCKLYECTGNIGMPPCVRGSLPASFGGCKEIASDPDCTNKGSFTFSGGGGGGTGTGGGGSTTTTPPPTPEVSFPPGATTTKIRCGTNWMDANSQCGTECTSNAQCTTAGEACFADLKDCPAGNTGPVDKPVRTPPATTPGSCVSKQAHIADSWCVAVKCAPVYNDYCSSEAAMVSASLAFTVQATAQGLTAASCVLHASFAGETWADVALIYDVEVAALKAANPTITGDLSADAVLEVPGDCQEARGQVAALQAAQGQSSPAPSQHACMLGLAAAAGLAAALTVD